MPTILVRDVASFVEDGVERPAPGKAPSAFRIWRQGENPTTKGMTVLSAAALEELLADQTRRGVLYSIDVDHLSLSDMAPPESRKAVGWHRLEARNGDLWAVDVEWTDIARAGLEKDPPEWRYFSPAYALDQKSREVTAYMNTALTNNPATHQVTALATRAGSQEENAMNEEEMRAALKAWAGDDEEKKAKADAHIKAAFPPAEDEKKDTDDGEEKKDTEGEEKKEPAEEKVAASAKTDPYVVELATRLKATEEELAQRRKNDEARERETVLASRKDLTPELVATLKKMPLALMKETIAAIPAPKGNSAHKVVEEIHATRGKTQNDGQGANGERPAMLPPEEHQALRQRMGLETATAGIRREGNAVVFGVLTPSQADAIVNRKKNAPGEGKEGAK